MFQGVRKWSKPRARSRAAPRAGPRPTRPWRPDSRPLPGTRRYPLLRCRDARARSGTRSAGRSRRWLGAVPATRVWAARQCLPLRAILPVVPARARAFWPERATSGAWMHRHVFTGPQCPPRGGWPPVARCAPGGIGSPRAGHLVAGRLLRRRPPGAGIAPLECSRGLCRSAGPPDAAWLSSSRPSASSATSSRILGATPSWSCPREQHTSNPVLAMSYDQNMWIGHPFEARRTFLVDQTRLPGGQPRGGRNADVEGSD